MKDLRGGVGYGGDNGSYYYKCNGGSYTYYFWPGMLFCNAF